MADEHEIEHTELEAVLETRRELGASYDAALVESFADRIEAAVLARTASDLGVRSREARDRAATGPRQLALGIVSVVAGIPVTAIRLAVPENGGVQPAQPGRRVGRHRDGQRRACPPVAAPELTVPLVELLIAALVIGGILVLAKWASRH